MKVLILFFEYLKNVFRYAPKRFLTGCTLTTMDAFLSGFGLLLLIPILHYAGWLPSNLYQEESWMTKLLHLLPAPHKHLPLLFTFLIFILLITTIAAISFSQQQIMSKLRQDYLLFLTQKLNQAVAHAKWDFLLHKKLQHVEQMMNTGLPQIDLLTFHSLQMISSLTIISIFTAFSFCISFYLTIIVCLIAFALLLTLNSRKLFSTGKEIFEAYRQSQEQLAKFLDGIKMAKSYNQVDSYLAHFDQLNRRYQKLRFASISQRGINKFLYLAISAITISVIFLIGILFLKLNIVTLTLLLIIFSRLLPKVAALQQDYIFIITTTPVFQQAQIMLNEFNQEKEHLNIYKNISLKKYIEFFQVSFAYQQKKVLENISFKILSNTTVAIVGESGAGKSTLADLLLGLLSPQQGEIFIDEATLDTQTLNAWRESVSYVSQDAYFFNDSIRANLLWAAPNVTEDQIWQALASATAKHFVKTLPQQLDTSMGDRGIHFSSGEKQRLALARALLRQPKILLLDEATNALDSHNEELIYQTLQHLHGKITVIIITHRYSTIRHVDSVLVLDKGVLVEIGRPNELLADKDSTFKRLFYSQMIN